jgi:hypothetical protein
VAGNLLRDNKANKVADLQRVNLRCKITVGLSQVAIWIE